MVLILIIKDDEFKFEKTFSPSVRDCPLKLIFLVLGKTSEIRTLYSELSTTLIIKLFIDSHLSHEVKVDGIENSSNASEEEVENDLIPDGSVSDISDLRPEKASEPIDPPSTIDPVNVMFLTFGKYDEIIALNEFEISPKIVKVLSSEY